MAKQLSIFVNIVTFGVLCYLFETNNGIGPTYYMLVKAGHSNQLTCLSVSVHGDILLSRCLLIGIGPTRKPGD